MRRVFPIIMLAVLANGRAEAIELKLLGQPLRMDITESLFAAYHGNLGYLVVERDSKGPHPENHYYDVLNRLNVDLAWKRFRLATRFDTGVFFDTPAGSCGAPQMTPIAVRSKFCGVLDTSQPGWPDNAWPQELYFWPEKVALEYSGRTNEATLGDFYISLGRGLVLSLRKIDELGVDTTLLGGKYVFHEGPVGATLAIGVTNIQNIDEATGRFAPDPFDFIAAGRVEYRLLDRVIIGVHEAGGLSHRNAVETGKPQQRDAMLMYGGTVEAPHLLRWLGLYFEGAGQLQEAGGKGQTGYALYGAATGYFGAFTAQLEFKHYVHFQRWRSSVDASLPEFAPIAYNLPPTAERLVTELLSPIYDASGPRFRIDWRASAKLLVYASYAYFEDRGNAAGKAYYHDPYAGAELRWDRGASHFFPSGGYRLELCDSANKDCLSSSPNGSELQHIGHVEWDAAQALPRGLSVETQGFALFRQGEKVSTTDAGGNMVYPTWTEGDAYLALKWTPHLILTGGFEWSTRPSPKLNQYYFNGAVQWNITTASSIRLFVGGTRGGLKCVAGISREFPAFTGARLEVVVRL